MTTCPFCNAEIQDGLTFCPECGKKLVSGPELPKRELHATKPALLTVLILCGVLFLILVVSMLCVLIPKQEKAPNYLLEEAYDQAFGGSIDLDALEDAIGEAVYDMDW